MGTSGKRGTEEWNLETGANPKDQGCCGPPPEQQNVKAVSVQHCAATTAPRNCCPNCYAEQSHKDNIHSSTVGKQLKQKKSNSPAQHHLPALDLFWASSFFVRVQLTSLLLISPGLCRVLWKRRNKRRRKEKMPPEALPSTWGSLVTHRWATKMSHPLDNTCLLLPFTEIVPPKMRQLI